MVLTNLTIELTRRCNLSCEHCLRGCPENMDIRDEYIDYLFNRVEEIGTLTLTGGEPSLVPDKIFKILEIAEKRNVRIDSFYMVTNARRTTDEFMRALLALYLYCYDKDECSLQISNDYFHYCCNTDEQEFMDNSEKLKAFRFTSDKFSDKDIDRPYKVIDQGYASLNCPDKIDHSISSFEVEEDYISGDANVYLNCKGVILPDCNLSYETQDNCSFLQLGKVTHKNFDLVKACKKFNKRLEKLGSSILDDVLNADFRKVA